MRLYMSCVTAFAALFLSASFAAAEDSPTRQDQIAQADGPMVITPQPQPNAQRTIRPGPSSYPQQPDAGGPGMPYEPAPGTQTYYPPEAQSQGTFSMDEIKETGHRFFGKVSMGFARVVEYTFQRSGRPNGYILGEEMGGAFVAGLRYGEGTLYTKDAGHHQVFWQGPSLGYDFGADGSKTMVLVYDLRSPGEIYNDFAGVDGSAYFIGGVGVTYLSGDRIVLAPIRSGLGLRLGANIGYLKYTREPTWNPF